VTLANKLETRLEHRDWLNEIDDFTERRNLGLIRPIAPPPYIHDIPFASIPDRVD
jgi:hypothetical protein